MSRLLRKYSVYQQFVWWNEMVNFQYDFSVNTIKKSIKRLFLKGKHIWITLWGYTIGNLPFTMVLFGVFLCFSCRNEALWNFILDFFVWIRL